MTTEKQKSINPSNDNDKPLVVFKVDEKTLETIRKLKSIFNVKTKH